MLIVGRISLGFGIGEKPAAAPQPVQGVARHVHIRRCRVDVARTFYPAPDMRLLFCPTAACANQSVPLYLSEMAPHHARGAMNIM